MSKLILMVGIPGSGKSTWIKNNFPNITPVSRDVIRFEILDERGGNYFDYEDEVFDKFIHQIVGSLVIDEVTIADATHVNRKGRAKVLNAVKKYITPDEVECIVLDVSPEVAIERNNQREGRAWVPPKVIRNMFFRMEIPKKEEGFNKITIIRG